MYSACGQAVHVIDFIFCTYAYTFPIYAHEVYGICVQFGRPAFSGTSMVVTCEVDVVVGVCLGTYMHQCLIYIPMQKDGVSYKCNVAFICVECYTS